MIASLKGYLLKCEEATLAKHSMEEAIICNKSPCQDLINEEIEVCVDGIIFPITVREDPSLLKEDLVHRKSVEEEEESEDVSEEGWETEAEDGGGGESKNEEADSSMSEEADNSSHS